MRLFTKTFQLVPVSEFDVSMRETTTEDDKLLKLKYAMCWYNLVGLEFESTTKNKKDKPRLLIQT